MYLEPFSFIWCPNFVFYLNSGSQQAEIGQQIVNQEQGQAKCLQDQVQDKKLKIYIEIFLQQITKLRQNNIKKLWTSEQDAFLSQLDPDTTNWNDIAERIPNTNAAICKRRFNRLRQQLIKWPKEIDSDIINLFERQKLSWSEIRKIINQKYIKVYMLPKFTTNKIKQRYNLYLRPGISKDEWSVDQDIEIVKSIKKYGKQWTKALKQNQILKHRTELQLKNRYFGTLKFLEKKVMRKVAINLKSPYSE